jgi:hypothetical protein
MLFFGAAYRGAIIKLDLKTLQLPNPLRFVNCPDLADDVFALMRGWGQTLDAAIDTVAPFLTVERKHTRFHWHSEQVLQSYTWAQHPPRSTMTALVEIHYELSDWFVERNPGYFCLHCAGVRFGDGVVIFPSDQRAGKSVLSMQLAQRGHELFGDDVVAIEPKKLDAYALGLLPRLRRPFPESLGKEFEAFIAARPGPENHQYRYVGLEENELARLGVTAPIKGLVLLERVDSGPALIESVSQGEMLARLIRKNFATDMPVTHIFDRLKKLTEQTECIRLRYSSGQSAIEALGARFGT